MTKIYLIRHADTLKENLGVYIADDTNQEMNEKCILSTKGEEEAKQFASKEEIKQIKVLWTSNAVRAISTAKYISENNNIKLNINEEFKERIIGEKQGNPNYFKEQIEKEDYKYNNGESRKDVQTRMYNTLNNIFKDNKNETIGLVTHSQAMLFLLMKWTNVEVIDGNKREIKITFNDQEIFKGNIKNLETFELNVDDEMNLKEIKHII
jgi:broad specificity phosphatase PhoE